MKKKLVLFGTLFTVLLFFVACGSKSLTATDIDAITMTTTTKDLESKLGKPEKTIEDSTEAEALLQEDSATISSEIMTQSDAIKSFVGSSDSNELLSELTSLATDDDFKVYQYKYKDGDDEKTVNFYIVGDKVVLRSF